MRAAEVLVHGRRAGRLTQSDDGGFAFAYDAEYLADGDAPPVSLTLPKRPDPYRAPALFSAFWQLLPEGHNKRVLCRSAQIDPDDAFGILLRVATEDTVGAVTVKPANRG